MLLAADEGYGGDGATAADDDADVDDAAGAHHGHVGAPVPPVGRCWVPVSQALQAGRGVSKVRRRFGAISYLSYVFKKNCLTKVLAIPY